MTNMLQGPKTYCFKPIQPSSLHEWADISYKEYMPAPSLRGYIYCYWELKSLERLSTPLPYYVVSDGCIDIFIDVHTLSDIDIMGLSNKYHAFSLSHDFHYIGIRFLPAAFSSLFKFNASALTDYCEPLNFVNRELHKRLNNLIARHWEAAYRQPDMVFNLHQLIEPFNAFFNQIARQATEVDFRFKLAFDKIVNTRGIIDIEHLNVPVSSRHLRRLFKFYVGESPKAFSKIVRFQSLLSLNPTVETLKTEKFFYELGYYDQAHFIKEFKRMCGFTPAKAFK
ncbi:helix-turn-helix domain-containing protein [Olivibacter sp. 47]|uniref:AraC family transcriptional regulator n=1 Tax=Olivibacter sp. 47 TaxID=3056486 RepID=UPI0025A40F92|nr:helix-turn-helix domain-containing protein [Olivibacter sp. 47]MDM8174985.1 helix-turn-helix domain-containing protein [Olivibacter sp. 47]